MRGWVAAAILVLLSACARHPESPLFTGEPYLLVWAGDADRQSSDFLAVLDADPTSPSYGKVLRTYPVPSRGNEPQALLAMARGRSGGPCRRRARSGRRRARQIGRAHV